MVPHRPRHLWVSVNLERLGDSGSRDGLPAGTEVSPLHPRSPAGITWGDGTWDQHPSASSEHPTAVFRSLQAPRNPGVPLMWGSPPGGGQRHGQPGRGATQATVTSSHRRLPEQPVDPPIDCALGISGHRPSTHRLLPRWTLSHYGEPVWDAGAAGHRLPPSPAKSYQSRTRGYLAHCTAPSVGPPTGPDRPGSTRSPCPPGRCGEPGNTLNQHIKIIPPGGGRGCEAP
jgi:hypothetical protein